MRSWKVIFEIAKTHLFTKLKSTVTASIGVTFGIAAYITLVSFMTGLNSMLDDLMLNQVPHIHLYNEIKPSEKQPIALYNDFEDALPIIHSIKPRQGQRKIHNALPILDDLEKNEKVQGATPQLQAQIFYLSGNIELGGNLTGVDIIKESKLSNIQDYITEGSVLDLKNTENGILLGSGIAEKLSLSLGRKVLVSTARGDRFHFKVVGIYQSGIAEIDDIQSFANLKTVQRILGEAENYITDINIKLNDIARAPALASVMEKKYNVSAVDINEINAQFETGTKVRNLITYAVSITLLIVAGFGIYNIQNMLIYEKMNDIAILKAIGFSGADVQMIFLSQAAFIGISGGILGLVLGLGLSNLIDNVAFETEALPTITTYPVNYNPNNYIIGFFFALLCTFIAAYFPSKKAKNIDPVQIIRGN
ncbi:ABC transporter permease [Salegentibacter sediminis]|uniref:ABC transporter permease n=1 Tax=Salegentibacter sediminis TaxID=1930251 RepID=UPI0009BDA88A|nr:FtsX-like permease family protein [Salegentibacter sediminis]